PATSPRRRPAGNSGGRSSGEYIRLGNDPRKRGTGDGQRATGDSVAGEFEPSGRLSPVARRPSPLFHPPARHRPPPTAFAERQLEGGWMLARRTERRAHRDSRRHGGGGTRAIHADPRRADPLHAGASLADQVGE